MAFAGLVGTALTITLIRRKEAPGQTPYQAVDTELQLTGRRNRYTSF